jgi:glucoside 3-dehydrogenase (cytochrome c) hitch-hiker subunit
MNRRDAVKATGALLGGVLITTNGFLIACARDEKKTDGRVLSASDQALLEDVADTLLPTTPSSPGARAAGAGAAINLLLTDCYEPKDQERVVDGLKQFRDTVGDHFASMNRTQREDWLQRIDAQAKAAGDQHYFHLVRELALQAYFSSEIGMTKALRYVMTPGKWVGCVPLQPNQPAWA